MLDAQNLNQGQLQKGQTKEKLLPANFEEQMTWQMRWFLIIALTIGYLASITSGILGYWVTKDPRYRLFISPTALTPFIIHLVPMDKRRYELLRAKIDAKKRIQTLEARIQRLESELLTQQTGIDKPLRTRN